MKNKLAKFYLFLIIISTFSLLIPINKSIEIVVSGSCGFESSSNVENGEFNVYPISTSTVSGSSGVTSQYVKTGSWCYKTNSESTSRLTFDIESDMLLTKFWAYQRVSAISSDSYIHYYFYNNTYGEGTDEDSIIHIFQDYPLSFGFYDDNGDFVEVLDTYSISSNIYQFFGFDITDIEVGGAMYYFGESSDLCDSLEGAIRNPQHIIDGYIIDRLDIDVSGDYTYNRLDSIIYSFTDFQESEPPQGGNSFYINLIDGSTQATMNGILNYCFSGPPSEGTNVISLSSPLWNGYYCSGSGLFTSPFQITGTEFTEGNYYFVNVTCFKAGGISYIDASKYLRLYQGNTYNIVIYPQSYATWENSQEVVNNGLSFGIRLDKFSYSYNEQVLIQYKIPTVEELISKGMTSNLEIKGYIAQDFWETTVYLPTGEVFECNQYNNNWVDAEPYSPSQPSTGHHQVNFLLRRVFFEFLGIKLYTDFAIVYAQIYDYETLFSPQGNITLIEPEEPLLGETVSVTFDANNNGTLSIKHVDSGMYAYGPFAFNKPNPDSTITFIPDSIGLYQINLEVYDGSGLPENVDIEFFYVNSTGDDYEEMGYNVEFLTVKEDRVIAGFDTLTILYRTLQNNTKLTIDSPKNARNPFSVFVSNESKYGTYTFDIPPWFTIGLWNVTLYGEETLTDYFWVIAEENNYAEFEKKSYIIGDTVNIYIRHDKRIKLIMYKDSVAYGEQLFLDNKTNVDSIIPWIDNNVFTEGVWELQLWEVNERIPRKLLSSDYATFFSPKVDTGDFGGLVGIGTIPPPFSYFAGILIVIIFSLSPFLILKITKRNDEVDLTSIPQFIYMIMAIVGFVVSIMMGFFPAWSVIVVCVLGALIIAITYIKGKGISTE